MNAKAYLKQIKELDIKINNKIVEKESLYTMATKVTPTLSEDKVSGNFNATDKVGNIVAKIVDIEREINAAIDEYFTVKNTIIRQIEQLQDERYYNLLHKRYVQYKDFSIIADEMGYEYRVIINLHGDALKSFYKKFLKNKTDDVK